MRFSRGSGIRPRSILALFLCLLGALPTTASAEEEFPGWFSAYISGSERLGLYAAGQAGIRDVIPRLVYQTGGAHKGRIPQIVAKDISFSPIFYYDTNFNGGSSDPHVVYLSGFPLTVGDLAESGFVGGASVNGGIKASYRTGSTVLLSAGGSAEWLINKGMKRQLGYVNACAEHHLTGWTWLDGCMSSIRVLRSYDSHVSQHSFSLGPTVVYQTGGLSQQFSIRGTRTFMEQGPQNAIEADWIGAFPNIGAISIGAMLAEELEQENTSLREASVGLVRPIKNRPVKFDLYYYETGGFSYGDQVREDRGTVFSVRFPINEQWRFNASLGARNSTIDAYDETITRLNIEYTGDAIIQAGRNLIRAAQQ